MNFDFETPMTFYELVGIILGVAALVIPFVKWIILKWFKRLKLDFIAKEDVTLYFNISGSYINFGGVYTSKNKSTTIKNIYTNVKRISDNAILKLVWSTFASPVFKEIGGQYEHSFETAYPFRTQANSLSPVFVEFVSDNTNISEEISSKVQPLYNRENDILRQPNATLFQADSIVHSLTEYTDAKLLLNEYLFWKSGKYEIELITEYENSVLKKKYEFDLTEYDVRKLQCNLEKMLVRPVAECFNSRLIYNTVRKKVEEIRE